MDAEKQPVDVHHPIMFSFKAEVSEKQRAQLCGEIAAIPGVVSAKQLNPDGKSELTRNIYYLYVAQGVKHASVLEQVRKLDQIKHAEQPAERFLIE